MHIIMRESLKGVVDEWFAEGEIEMWMSNFGENELFVV